MLEIMMNELTVEDKKLTDGLHLKVESKSHCALIGQNGIGKTTLLKKMLRSNDDVMMLEQNLNEHAECVLDYLLSVNTVLLNIKLEMAEDYSKVALYSEENGYEFENEAITHLKRFHLDEAVLDRPVNTLSGGEQTKIAIIRLLMSKKSNFIFDEPTNHIDEETREWLIDWMNSNHYTILFVTHDRDFINRTAHMIFELSEAGIRSFSTNYDGYREQKALELKTNEQKRMKEQKEKKKMKEMIQEFKEWHHTANATASVRDPAAQKKVAKIAKRYKTKEHQLNQKMERFDSEDIKKQSKLSLTHGEIDNKKYVTIDHMDYGYDNSPLLFEDISLQILQGDKIHLKGKNGTGKSTFIQLVRKQLQPNNGQVFTHPQLKIGYFSQQLDILDFNKTVLDDILSIEGIKEMDARTMLAAFEFGSDRMDDVISSLSMGEKCRLAFVKLYFSGTDMLILDEPTNYLDIETSERIETMLQQYEGTILFVSHDQYFANKIKNRTIEIKDHQLIDSHTTIDKEIDTEKLTKDIQENSIINDNPDMF